MKTNKKKSLESLKDFQINNLDKINGGGGSATVGGETTIFGVDVSGTITVHWGVNVEIEVDIYL